MADIIWHDSEFQKGATGEMNFDPEFKEAPMMEQLGRIMDSAEIQDVVPAEKYRPVVSVKTDDGDEIDVTATEAKRIRDAVMGIAVKDRLEALKFAQTTEGLTTLLKTVRM